MLKVSLNILAPCRESNAKEFLFLSSVLSVLSSIFAIAIAGTLPCSTTTGVDKLNVKRCYYKLRLFCFLSLTFFPFVNLLSFYTLCNSLFFSLLNFYRKRRQLWCLAFIFYNNKTILYVHE